MHKWGVDEETLHDLLARITVERIGANTLAREVKGRLSSTVNGDPEVAFGLLRTFLVAKLNRRLTAHMLWGRLESHGHGRRPGGPDAALSERVRSLANRYSRGVTAGRPSRLAFVDRDEVGKAAGLLTSESPVRVVTLTGPPGVGKTAVCAAVVDELARRGVVVGALRLDQATSAATEGELGDQPAVGFGGPIAQIMAAAAAGEPCVLVIDQLDALSAASGRAQPVQAGLRDTLLSLQAVPGLRLLIACRSHDLKYDRGLKRLLEAAAPEKTSNQGTVAPIALGELTDPQVNTAVTSLGLIPAELSPQLRVLLRNPFNLSLLADIVDAAEDAAEPLQLAALATRVDLISRYHVSRAQNFHRILGVPNLFATEVYRVAARMSQDGLLSVADSFLADRPETRQALLGEGVLIADAGRLRFFHQSYFEYVFAQHHLQGERTALELLNDDPLQDLLRRGQVRMVLALERETEPRSYAADLRSVLTAAGVRAHIRMAVLDWLTDTDLASDDELSIVEDYVTGGHRPKAVRVLSSAPYARALAAHGHLITMANALKVPTNVGSEPASADQANGIAALPLEDLTFVLVEAARNVPEQVSVACLPLAQDCGGFARTSDLLRLVFLAGPGASAATVKLLTSVIATVRDVALASSVSATDPNLAGSAALPSAVQALFSREDGLYALRTLIDRAPELAMSAFSDWLSAAVAIAEHRGDAHIFESLLPREATGLDTFQRLAKRDAVAFALQVVPILADQANRAKHPWTWSPVGDSSRPLHRDAIWLAGAADTSAFAGELMEAATAALTAAALSHPTAIRPLLTQLSTADLLSAQQLVAAAYAACGEELVDDALTWAGQPHLRGLPGNGKPAWATVLAHAAATTMGKEDTACMIAIDAYPPLDPGAILAPATDPLPQQLAREEQATLTAIEDVLGDRVPSNVLEILTEITGLLGAPLPPLPIAYVGRVTSPIPDEEVSQFTDTQWLTTIAAYPDSEAITGPDRTGGAYEIAHQLSEATRRAPHRFATLLTEKIESTVNPDYSRAVLNGLGNPLSPLDAQAVDAILLALRTVFEWRDHSLLRDACRLVRSLANGSLPDDLLTAIVWAATQAHDPDTEVWQQLTTTGSTYYSGNIVDAGLNSDRGYAVDTIAALLAPPTGHAERVGKLVPALRTVLQDPLQQVRVMIPQALLYLSQTQVATSAELARRWLRSSTEAMLRAPELTRLAYALYRTDWQLSLNIADRLLTAEQVELRQAGGQLTAALARSETHDAAIRQGVSTLLQRALADTESRTGLAQQIALMVNDLPDDLPETEGLADVTDQDPKPGWQLLIALLDDPDPAVRKAASGYVTELERALDDYRSLFARVAGTRAFPDHSGFLLTTISYRFDEIPASVLDICQAWLNDNEQDLARSAKNRGRARSAVDVILSIHAQTVDTKVRHRCLDLLDAMIMAGVDEASQAVDQSDE